MFLRHLEVTHDQLSCAGLRHGSEHRIGVCQLIWGSHYKKQSGRSRGRQNARSVHLVQFLFHDFMVARRKAERRRVHGLLSKSSKLCCTGTSSGRRSSTDQATVASSSSTPGISLCAEGRGDEV